MRTHGRSRFQEQLIWSETEQALKGVVIEDLTWDTFIWSLSNTAHRLQMTNGTAARELCRFRRTSPALSGLLIKAQLSLHTCCSSDGIQSEPLTFRRCSYETVDSVTL